MNFTLQRNDRIKKKWRKQNSGALCVWWLKMGGGGERLNIRLLLHTHSHRGNSESNEINHSLGVSACFLCTSFLRQPTAKLDYVFLLINFIFFFFTWSSFAFQLERIIQQQKKGRKNLQGRKKTSVFLSQQQPFSFGPALFHVSFSMYCSWLCFLLTLVIDKE